MSTGPAAESFILRDGEGLIDIRGDGFDCGLIVERRPVAFFWEDCQGSIAQYLIRSRDTRNLSARLRSLRTIAEGEFHPTAPLASQVRPLLSLLANGKYQISFTPALEDVMVVNYDSTFSYEDDRWNFYPDGSVLIVTQPVDTLRKERIHYFRERINAGARPIVFAFGLATTFSCDFVLDGHHKLQAYQELHIPPALLFIRKQDLKHLTVVEGLEFLDEAQKYRADYCRIKKENGSICVEADWFDCINPQIKLDAVRGRITERKMRLFMAACFRLIFERSKTNAGLLSAVEVAERYADGTIRSEELDLVRQTLWAARPLEGSEETVDLALAATGSFDLFRPGGAAAKCHAQVTLIDDIFGNPFRLVSIEPAWLAWNDGTVRNLAQAIYDERELPSGHLDAARLAILTDALEEAGCTNGDILSHCRSPGPHVCGCWVIDLLLGKE